MDNRNYKFKKYNNNKFIKRDFSKAVLTPTTWMGVSANVFPDFDLNRCIDMINFDPVARGALNHFVAKCMEGDISYIKADDHSYDDTTEGTLDENFMFRTEVLRKIFYELRLFNNAYVEIVKTTDNKTKAINVLNSLNVEPGVDHYGDSLGYTWRIVDPKTGKKPRWESEEITWIKYNDQSRGIATLDLQAIWENLLLKSYVKRYVAWLWKTGQYKVMYGFNAPQRTVDDFIAYLKNTEEDYTAPFLFGGEFKKEMVRDMQENQYIISLLDSLDYQTAILMRVNPNSLGIPDTSGRSNADAQSNSFATDITDIKKLVEDYINFKVFPKINKSNTLMRFGPNDRFSEEQTWKIIQTMKASGCTNDSCIEYLKDRGMFFAATIFMPMLDPTKPSPDMVAKSTGPDNPAEKNSAISRQGKTEGTANDNTGDVTTRPDQLSSNTVSA